MIQLNILQMVSVITTCSIMVYAVIRALQYMAKLFKAIMGIIEEIKQFMFEHDMMWVDYCVRHNMPIRTDPKGRRRRTNGSDEVATGAIV